VLCDEPEVAVALRRRIVELPDGAEPDTLAETQLRQLLKPGT
jgi:hypothetical protein